MTTAHLAVFDALRRASADFERIVSMCLDRHTMIDSTGLLPRIEDAASDYKRRVDEVLDAATSEATTEAEQLAPWELDAMDGTLD